MMLTLQLNREDLFNDAAEVIRAYTGMADIRPGAFESASGAALEARIDDNIAYARGRLCDDAAVQEYIWRFETREERPLLKKRADKRALKIAIYRLMQGLLPDIALPWGALTGIRPTKLLRELIETQGEGEALRVYAEDFDVKPDKAALARRVIAMQRPILARIAQNDVDVYVGIPYCKTRCLYCSFASQVIKKGGVPEDYLQALKHDILLGASLIDQRGYRPRALYIGGGTPTVLTLDELGALIRHILDCYGKFEELTVEAGRPDTMDADKLRLLRDLGVDRLSINPQSMSDETLTRIGRGHSAGDIERVFALARGEGFPVINMDVIAGLPGESIADFSQTLEHIIALSPENLTVHTLAIKRSSRLKESLEAYPLPTKEDTERMTALGAEAAERLNMAPYYMYRQKYMQGNLENVGYTISGLACLYNVDMMEEGMSIMAHGAGAMTKRVFPGRDLRVERIPAPKDIATYIAKLERLNEKKRELF